MSRQSVVTNRDRNCMTCRLFSGIGLIGAGLYVSYQSKRINKKPGTIIVYSVASVLGFLGITRILDLPPFRNQYTT